MTHVHFVGPDQKDLGTLTEYLFDDAAHEESWVRLRQYTPSEWSLLGDHIAASSVTSESSTQEVLRMYQLMFNFFCFDFVDSQSIEVRSTALFRSHASIHETQDNLMCNFGTMHAELQARNLLNENSMHGDKLLAQLNMIAYSMQSMYHFEIKRAALCNLHDPEITLLLKEQTPISIFTPDNPVKDKPTELFMHYQHIAFSRGYRILDDVLYRPKYNAQGQYIHFYEAYCTVKTFLYMECKPISQNMYWFTQLNSNGRMPAQVVRMFQDSFSEFCPRHKSNPLLHSFGPGCLYLEDGELYFHTKRAHGKNMDDLPKDVCRVASTYHDMDFDYEQYVELARDPDAGRAIPEVWRTLFEPHGFSDQCMLIIAAMIGRLLYPMKSHDEWQCVLWFFGPGGVGKSTIINDIIGPMFQPGTLGILNNKTEPVFGLMSLRDKQAYVATDVDENFQLDQANFNSMSAGDPMSIAVKGKNQIYINPWNLPGVYASNAMPGSWKNNGGNLERRLCVAGMNHMIHRVDPSIPSRIKQQFPHIMFMCVNSYLALSQLHGRDDFWSFVPEKFLIDRNNCIRGMDPLYSFLSEMCDVQDKETVSRLPREQVYTCSKKQFRDAFKQYLKDENIRGRVNDLLVEYGDGISKVPVSIVKGPNNVATLFGLRLKPRQLPPVGAVVDA